MWDFSTIRGRFPLSFEHVNTGNDASAPIMKLRNSIGNMPPFQEVER